MEFENSLSINQEKKLEQNIVWVFGDVPSWLLPVVFNSYPKILTDFNLGFHLEKPTWRGKDMISLSNLTEGRQGEGKFDYFFNDGYYDVWAYYFRQLVLNRLFAQFHDISSSIIIDESKMNSGSIIKIFKNSKSIIFLQDKIKMISQQAYKFIESKSVAWMGGKKVNFNDRFSVLEYFSRRYKFFEKNLLDNLKDQLKEKCLFVDWADLQNDESIIKNILKFSGMSLQGNITQTREKFLDNLNRDFQNIKFLDLNDKEINLINEIIQTDGIEKT